MNTVLVVDRVGDARDAIEQAAVTAGWNVLTKAARTADAVIFATDADGMEQTLANVAASKRSGAAVVLIADLSHAGRALNFGGNSTAAHDVDAMFERPLTDADAIFRRLNGIMTARVASESAAAPEMSVILTRAMANEESSAAFYRQAASRVSDPVTRDVIEGLMRDEIEHKRYIEEFMCGARPLPTGTTSGGSLVESLDSPAFAAEMSPADAFLLAAKKEKLAVQFYETWSRLYPEGPERSLLLSLAEIERRHKQKVEDLFTNAAFPEAW